MTLSADDRQTAGFAHLVAEFDVRTATCHVRGNRYGAQHALFFVTVAVFVRDHHLSESALSGLGYDLRLLLVQFCIQNVVRNVAKRQHTAQ